MKKIACIITLLFSNSFLTYCQNIDSLFISTKVNNYLFFISESRDSITPDSCACFHFDNDTIIIEVQLNFTVEHDSTSAENIAYNSPESNCGSTTGFISRMIGDKIHFTNDTVLFTTIDSAYYFTETITTEQWASLDTAEFNCLSKYEYIDEHDVDRIVYLYQIVHHNFHISLFGTSKSADSALLKNYLDLMIPRYEYYFPPF